MYAILARIGKIAASDNHHQRWLVNVNARLACVRLTYKVAYLNEVRGTFTQSALNWAVVPGPTSGLLMLLGMAGLAIPQGLHNICRHRQPVLPPPAGFQSHRRVQK